MNKFMNKEQEKEQENKPNHKDHHTMTPDSLIGYLLKDIKDFADRQLGYNVDISEFYIANDIGFRILIPEGFDGGRLNFTEIACIHLPEFYANWDMKTIKRIIDREIPKPNANRDYNIAKRVIIVLADKIKGIAKSKRLGDILFLIFHAGKLSLKLITSYIFKILGRWYIKRGKRIEEATIEKTGKEPWGYLAELVEFFKNIGDKLYKGFKKLFAKINYNKNSKECANNKCNYSIYNTSNSNNYSNNNYSNNNNNSKVLTYKELVLLNATPVLPQRLKRIVI